MYPITYLTDCVGGNAVARLSLRIGALFGQSPIIVGVEGADPESFTARTLVDCLRSTAGGTHPTVLLFNIAPRDGHWPNGVPFCFFRYGVHLVAGTFNPRVLDVLRRELGITEVQVTDIAEVLDAVDFDPIEAERIVNTQFRSLWYLPLLALWVTDGTPVPATPTAVSVIADDGPLVTVVDNFGNCKLDRAPDELKLAGIPRYPHLTAVPRNEPGLIPGSSEVAELVVRGGSAAEYFGLQQGDRLDEDRAQELSHRVRSGSPI